MDSVAVDEGPRAALPAFQIVHLGDDVGAIAHADELRIVCTLHLRRGDLDEALHHDVARQRRIPARRQELGCIGSMQRGQRREQQGCEES